MMIGLIVGAIAIAGVVLYSNVNRPNKSAGSSSADATTGWFEYSGATITRVAAGDTSKNYGNGVQASTGEFYARINIDPSPDSCSLGKLHLPIHHGPFTNWGGHSKKFPPGGFTTAVDIYLDVDFAIANPDTRFDWSSAISDTSGNRLRDFVFNVGTDASGFVVTAGNSANRCEANPSNPHPDHPPVIHITQSGWYRFKHTFTGDVAGPLSVSLTVASAASPNPPLATWMLSNPSDVIGATVGGNNDGSFLQNEFDGLAIDNTTVGELGDLGVETDYSPDPARVGKNLTYTIHVTNNAPGPATGVTMSDTPPGTTDVELAKSTQGTCKKSKIVVACDLGTLPSGVTVTVTIEVKPAEAGTILNTATVSGASLTDSNAANDTAIESTIVLP